MKKLINIILGVLILIISWEILVVSSKSLFFPNIYEIIISFGHIFKPLLAIDIVSTLARMFIGLSLAIILGVPLGLILGYYRKIYDLFEFIIDFLRSIPPPALFPLFMLVFGIGNSSKIAPIVYFCTFYILINTMYGVKNAKQLRIKVGKIFGLSKLKIFTNIIFPEALPFIVTGVRLCTSISLILALLFEMFVGTRYGIGQRIVDFQILYEIPEMYAMIIIAGLLGYILNKGSLELEKQTIHWSGK